MWGMSGDKPQPWHRQGLLAAEEHVVLFTDYGHSSWTGIPALHHLSLKVLLPSPLAFLEGATPGHTKLCPMVLSVAETEKKTGNRLGGNLTELREGRCVHINTPVLGRTR